MNSTQIITALSQVVERPEYQQYAIVDIASAAWGTMSIALRNTNPCTACGGTGVDATKPFDPLTIVTDGQRCDVCDGRGFVIDDGDAAISQWCAAYNREQLRKHYPTAPDPMVGEDVKALRDRLRLSQAALAAWINRIDPTLKTSTTTVSRWENGRIPNQRAIAAMRIIETTAEHI